MKYGMLLLLLFSSSFLDAGKSSKVVAETEWHNSQKRMCPFCNEENNITDIDEYLRRVQEGTLNLYNKLNKHIKEEHDKDPLTCPKCSSSFAQDMSTHYFLTHTNCKQHKSCGTTCPLCNNTMTNDANARRHILGVVHRKIVDGKYIYAWGGSKREFIKSDQKNQSIKKITKARKTILMNIKPKLHMSYNIDKHNIENERQVVLHDIKENIQKDEAELLLNLEKNEGQFVLNDIKENIQKDEARLLLNFFKIVNNDKI